MKRVYDAPIMRPDTLNGQEKLKFTIIGAWTDKQTQNFVHALFISFKRSSPLSLTRHPPPRINDPQEQDHPPTRGLKGRRIWRSTFSLQTSPSETERTHSRSPEWAHDKALKSFMRRCFRNGAGVKGSVKTVKDSSPASKHLEKVRGLEKRKPRSFDKA